MEVAGVEPEQAKAKGSNGDIMAGSIRCLNREPPYKAVGGTLATAPSRRSKQGGMRCPLPNTLSRFNRMRDAVAPNTLLGELSGGQLKEWCQNRSGCQLISDANCDVFQISIPPGGPFVGLGRCQTRDGYDQMLFHLNVANLIGGTGDPQLVSPEDG